MIKVSALLFFLLFHISLFSEKPLIIFLNGTSSAGKSSIALQIQHLSKELFLHVGCDHFVPMLPASYLDGENAHLGFKHIQKSGPITSVQIGAVGKQFHYVMHRSMKNLLDYGFNLIIDEVLCFDDDFQDYLVLFKDYRVFFVGVKPPLEITEQREIARGDRIPGKARWQYSIVHQDKTYDLIIDSSKSTPEESAKIILQAIAEYPEFHAFQDNACFFQEKRN